MYTLHVLTSTSQARCVLQLLCFVVVATEVMTVFVFHEPSQLSTLQDSGLPGVVLNSLLMKNVSSIHTSSD